MRNFKLNFCAFLIVAFTATIGAQNEDNRWLFSVGISAVDLDQTGGQYVTSGPQV